MKDLPKTQAPVQIRLGTLEAKDAKSLVEAAREVANELAGVINRQELAVVLQGKKYVKVEGWTTLGVMLGCITREVDVREDNGRYIATVELTRISDGMILSRASAECGAPDEIWARRPRYARRSMAITRAAGKACRLAFSWVMTLAGYEPTPAEEMGEVSPSSCINPGQLQSLLEKIQALGLDREWVEERVRRHWKVEHLTDLTPEQLIDLMTRLPAWAEAKAKKANGEEDQVATLVSRMLTKAKEIRRKGQYADSS